jgi:hypothetical protein
MSLFQANVIVAMLAGFLGRRSEGHPGPDMIKNGLTLLNLLVQWERWKKELAPQCRSAEDARRKPG